MEGARTRLDTPRLTLEPLAQLHAGALYAIYRDPAVSRFLITRPRCRAEFRQIHDRALAFGESHGMWAVFPRGAHSLIGRVGFFAFGENARPELAFLLSSGAWNRGYATEACHAALDHALSVHPWVEVVAVVRPANTAAIRVVQKLGFSRERECQLKGKPAVLFQAARQRLDAGRRPGDCT